jgi:hypothetical protein
MTLILNAAGWAFCAAAWACQFLGWFRKMELFWADILFLTCNALWDIRAVTGHDRNGALIFTSAIVIWAIILRFHWRRRKRRGRLAAIGARTRARIAAMTARMRERPARPVLRPVPQGGAR